MKLVNAMTVAGALCAVAMALPVGASAAPSTSGGLSFSGTCKIAGKVAGGAVTTTCTTPIGTAKCTGTLTGSAVTGTCAVTSPLGKGTGTFTGTVTTTGKTVSGTGTVTATIDSYTLTCTGNGKGSVATSGAFTATLAGTCTVS